MKLWLARTEDNNLQLFPEKPFYKEGNSIWYYWKVLNPSRCILSKGSIIDPMLFPEVTFENSPMEVELKLIEK